VRGVDHTHVRTPTCTYARARGWSTPLVWPRRMSSVTFDVCSMADWTEGLAIASISCCCGSHVIHADLVVITMNSDYTCCAERLMLNLKGVGTKDG